MAARRDRRQGGVRFELEDRRCVAREIKIVDRIAAANFSIFFTSHDFRFIVLPMSSRRRVTRFYETAKTAVATVKSLDVNTPLLFMKQLELTYNAALT